MYVENGWLSLDPIIASRLTNSRTWMDFKMADTSERRVYCTTILLKYHDKVLIYNRDVIITNDKI